MARFDIHYTGADLGISSELADSILLFDSAPLNDRADHLRPVIPSRARPTPKKVTRKIRNHSDTPLPVSWNM